MEEEHEEEEGMPASQTAGSPSVHLLLSGGGRLWLRGESPSLPPTPYTGRDSSSTVSQVVEEEWRQGWEWGRAIFAHCILHAHGGTMYVTFHPQPFPPHHLPTSASLLLYSEHVRGLVSGWLLPTGMA